LTAVVWEFEVRESRRRDPSRRARTDPVPMDNGPVGAVGRIGHSAEQAQDR